MKGLFLSLLLALGILIGGATQANAAALVPLAPSSSSWGSDPIFVTAPAGDPRVFIVERAGVVRIVTAGVLQPTPFLSVPNVDLAGERGMQSIAFAPDYATSGLFYVFAVISGSPAQIRVLEYRVSSGNANVADPSSARIVLAEDVGADNHNGGQLAFGPDGYLYITIGENTVTSNAQTLSNVFGKVLRINPRQSGVNPYTVPPDNPFVATGGARTEIWALGLRNPFRASFAPNGQLVIADVGAGTTEEVNFGTPGANYGWPTCEGTCSNPSFVNPFFTYTHSDPPGSCAIIGGVVVSDPSLTGLTGRYIFGDFCTKELRTISLSTPGGGYAPAGLSSSAAMTLTSLGQDAAGCLYVTADHTAYRVADDASAGAACTIPLPVGTTPGTKATIRSTRLKATRKGRVKIKLRCDSPTPCAGKVSIRSSKKLRVSGRLKKVTLASRNYKTVAAGKNFTVTVRLARKNRKLLAHRGRIRVTVTATTKSPRSTAHRTLNLRAPG